MKPLKWCLDSADPKEYKDCVLSGLIQAGTTNPSLASKMGMSYRAIVDRILEILPEGMDLSVEVLPTDFDGMKTEAVMWGGLDKRIVVKIPIIGLPELGDGLKAVEFCTYHKIRTNVTLCFDPWQAYEAALAGAAFISPFVGRLDDIAPDLDIGLQLVQQIRQLYDQRKIPTEILFASVRSLRHLRQALFSGADMVTAPYSFIMQRPKLIDHPMSQTGLKQFIADAAKIPK